MGKNMIFQKNFITWIKSYLIGEKLFSYLSLCICTRSNFDFHLGGLCALVFSFLSVNQTAVKFICFKSYIDSLFKIVLKESLFSKSGFHFSDNIFQAKGSPMLSSLSHSFPVVSNIVSKKIMIIGTRKEKETEKDKEKQLQFKNET